MEQRLNSNPRGSDQKNKLNASRTSTNKVRTGCITCKKRHVKCDEAKPHCRNCLKNRGHCEGYVDVQSKKQRPSGPIQLRWDSRQAMHTASPTKQLHLDQVSLDFRDEKSLLYFDEFVRLVQGPWIAAGSKGDLWAVTLPQIARNNSTVRHAAIGLGALSKWYGQSEYETLRTASVPQYVNTKGDSHYFHSVAHYCHALKLQAINLLYKIQKAALDHVNHGMAVLLALLTDQDSNLYIASLAPNPKPLLALLADILTHLATQSRFILRGSLGCSPMLPNFTKCLRDKNYTVESFLILSNQLHQSSTTDGQIPTVFNYLDDFEEYWAVAQRSRTAIGPLLVEVVKDSGLLSSQDQGGIKKFWQTLARDHRIREFYEASTRDMQALDAAFLPLFNRIIMCDAASPPYLRAIHLRLQYLGVYAFENPMVYHDIDILQAQTPLYREYLSLAEIALRTAKRDLKNPAQQFSLQCGLAYHLLLVAFFCRDPSVRDEATLMLRDYPGQDGIWNAPSLYVLALRNRVVERVNASEGTPAEQWHRLGRREYLFENGGDCVIFCFLDKDKANEGWKLVEETVEVGGVLEDVCWQRRPLSASGKLLMGDVITLWEGSL